MKLIPSFGSSLLLLAACSTASTLLAQDPAPAMCDEGIVGYGDRASLPNPEYRLELSRRAGGGLLYFGASHSTDPAHPQFAEIEADWVRLKPTVAFYEGPARSESATREETIRQFGESGFVRFLAKRDGVRIERLEPDPRSEATYVMQHFPPEKTKLFYVLREVSRLRERSGFHERQLRGAVVQMLQHAGAMFPEIAGVIKTPEELQVAYRRYWRKPANWWEAPTHWFDPAKSSAETGGIFTNEINRASSEFRDQHMFESLLREVNKGERVLAVVGRDHVAAQAPALRCAIR